MKPRTLFLITLLCAAIASAQTVHAAPRIVTNTNDSGPGSLRECLLQDIAGDGISFDSSLNGQTITLTSGELVVGHNEIITGPGANNLTVDGNLASRVFHVVGGWFLGISGLKITNGQPPVFGGEGGGILSDHSPVMVSDCTVSGNFAHRGGGIANLGGTLTVTNSTISGNGCLDVGGGIASVNGTLTVTNSTISGNGSLSVGGGIGGFGSPILGGGGTLTVTNSTISGNSAATGGGIYHGRNFTINPTLTVTNSTISGNSAPGGGGGILNLGTLTVTNTILNAGASGENIHNDGGTVTSLGYNLSSDSGVTNIEGGTGGLTATGDQINTDPLLGPLEPNGGPTYTHKLMTGSPAIDAGTDLTALNGAIDDLTTGVTVTDATSIPAGVGFAIQIGSEQMIVDAKSGNALTVTRGANFTTALANSNGAAVNPAFDQRGAGFARKVGGPMDIGAFEVTNEFSISVTPSVQTVTQGGSTSYTISTAVTSGDGGYDVNFNDGDLGIPGASASFTPQSLLVGGSSTLNINAGTAAPGVHFIDVTGYSLLMSSSQSVIVQLIIIPAVSPTPTPTATPTPTPTPTPSPIPTPAYAAEVQQPINPDGSSVFKVRRGVVPVRFTLTQGDVATCGLPPATIAVTRTIGGSTGEIDESIYTGPVDDGSNFRIQGCQYVYNLSPSALGEGTYRVDIKINNQVVGNATFQLK